MARIRYLKPEFFDDYDLCQLKPLARLLFAGLWCWADREGRLQDEPVKLKKNILGYDSCNVDALLNDLQSAGFITRYSLVGKKYISVNRFTAHQRPHVKEVASSIPSPPSQNTPLPESESTDPEPLQEGAEHRTSTHLGDSQNAFNRKGTEQVQEQERQPVSGPVPPPEVNVEFREALRAVENAVGLLQPYISGKLIAELNEGTPPAWIIEAANQSAEYNKRSWRYIETVLKHWRDHGKGCECRKPKGGGPSEGEYDFSAFGPKAAAR